MTTTSYALDPTHTDVGFSQSPKSRVAFLGLGAMGQRMARRLTDAGVELTVWSRSGTSSVTGARVATKAQEAVADAQVVFSMVRDDAASRSVWLGVDGALAQVRADTIVIECSTVSPAWIVELSTAASRAGAHLLDAPVVGSRPQAESGGLVFLAGGAVDVVEVVRPLLHHMGVAIHHLGASPAGSYAKLLVNALFGVQVAALAQLLGFATRAQLDMRALMQALEALPVLSASAKAAAAGMLAGRFEPMFPVELAAKDFRYFLEAAAALGGRVPLLRAASEAFEEGRAHGLEQENLTAIRKLYA